MCRWSIENKEVLTTFCQPHKT
uniref:Uncharacterized protein n=1 Tax=Arundo donax TaxID=35708 RepID=A0A0A9H9D8_ARUDO